MKAVLAVCVLLLVSGCADRTNYSPLPTIDPDVKADLLRPSNCTTARQDIKTLEDEQASVGKQVLSGVRSILPISAVAGILMGDYKDRVKVATGQYNRDIEAKVSKIKSDCRIG